MSSLLEPGHPSAPALEHQRSWYSDICTKIRLCHPLSWSSCLRQNYTGSWVSCWRVEEHARSCLHHCTSPFLYSISSYISLSILLLLFLQRTQTNAGAHCGGAQCKFGGRWNGDVPYLDCDDGTGVYPLVNTHGPQHLTLML